MGVAVACRRGSSAAAFLWACSRSMASHALSSARAAMPAVWPSNSARTWCTTALASPMRPTSTARLTPISSGSMSIWMILASGANWRPKPNIQVSRAPTTRITSAFPIRALRAVPKFSGWSSGMKPRPIGEAIKGMPSVSTSWRSSRVGSDHRMPLPTISMGRSAVRNNSAARLTWSGSPSGRAWV